LDLLFVNVVVGLNLRLEGLVREEFSLEFGLHRNTYLLLGVVDVEYDFVDQVVVVACFHEVGHCIIDGVLTYIAQVV